MSIIILSGCGSSAPKAANIAIAGTLSGDILPTVSSAHVKVGPIQGKIVCNNQQTPTDSLGNFSLSLPPVPYFLCVASASTSYVAESLDFYSSSLHGHTVVLYFGGSDSKCSLAANTMSCSPLQLQPGNIVGTVSHQTGNKVKGIAVGCNNKEDIKTSGISMGKAELFTTTDSQGSFQMSRPPSGVYVCFAESSDTTINEPKTIIVKPLVTTTVDLSLCNHCVLSYHGGPVIHSLTAYLIYWIPPTTALDPYNSNPYFEAKISQYFHDISGSTFYNMVTQYYDWQGPIQNHVVIGGTFIDQAPYPKPGTTSKPLYDDDIQTEIQQDITQNNWPVTSEDEFFIFTADHIQICQQLTPTSYCTFGKNLMCGYHNYMDSTEPTIYAVITGTADSNCTFTGPTPNGDEVIDEKIDTLAHEHFESVTDPFWNNSPSAGWYQSDGSLNATNQEIGDLCENDYISSQFPDGGNITLNGHDYLIQHMWSNQSNRCAWG